MTPLEGDGLFIGRYQLLERIAAGGMGEVYVALQTGIGKFSRPIAVKLLLPHLAGDPKAVSMFLTEARVGAQMTHANIAQVYDVGLERDRYFIAMELVRGVALQKLIAGLKGAQEHISVDLLAFIGRSLCEGLHVAHEQRGPDGQPMALVHRDVTPHNVLIGVEGAVKLTDFGIARVADADRLSRPGIVLGKLGYLSPEQIMGQPLDRRVDLFAAGATLFHLAALEKPFDTLTGATLDPRRKPTVPLRMLRPDLPSSLVDAIERALAVDVNERFATARDLRNALPVPGPDAAEDLGRLVRRVCAAALIDLEAKTQRASQALELAPASPRATSPDEETAAAQPPRARGGTEALPQAEAEQPQVPAGPARSRAPCFFLLALSLVALGGVAGWFATRDDAPAAPHVLAVPLAPSPAPVPVPAPADAAVATAEVPAVDAGLPTPARVEVAAPAPRGMGLLTVEATPWGNVTLDNKDLGQTPTAEVRVPAGVHVMVVSCPDTNKTVKKKITVVAGQHLRVPLDLR